MSMIIGSLRQVIESHRHSPIERIGNMASWNKAATLIACFAILVVVAAAAAKEDMPGMKMGPSPAPSPSDAGRTITSSSALLTGLLAFIVSFLAVRGSA
ncbi:hypothetical protein PVL29_000843 [Vitis rotundifolia]|uniref:Uncharacterized protein n=1 Tax=Vitis rotundifolia TaxID=103349 RepID=A0AA39AL54_VITRO|nr:hypothetical protein PVL29_000843 [Vitis rotundifolia]